MPEQAHRRLRRTSWLFFILFFYVVAALVWWFISLERQNHRLAESDLEHLEARRATLAPAVFEAEQEKILRREQRGSAKYVSEGITFLLLIITGAAFVYRAIRRQFRLQQQQQNFMMAVTHELKTPISVARLNLETLRKYQLDPEKQQKLLRNTLDETNRLNFLTNNILVSAQLEGGRYNQSREELNLSDLLRDCIRDFRNRFPDRIIRDEIMEDAEVKGDPLLLQMLINNLLENALKYTPRDKPVYAGLKTADRQVRLEIRDEGPGIPESEKRKIFDKFYRIGNESTRTTQGTGLGLYLCKKIARDHAADITVTDHPPQGSNFAVTFNT